MGTSISNNGSPSKSPIVPPWVPELSDQPNVSDNDSIVNNNDDKNNDINTNLPLLAPVARWRSAKVNIGKYANSGNKNYLKRSLGHFVKRGLGGSGNATKRFSGTVNNAHKLYSGLINLSNGLPLKPDSNIDRDFLSNKSSREIIDTLVEVIQPINGTQDSEASRRSINNALSEVLESFIDVDLLKLSQEQVLFATECYISEEIYNRFALELGKNIREKAPDVRGNRLSEVQDFIKADVSRAFKMLLPEYNSLKVSQIKNLAMNVLKQVFNIFEDYIK